MTAAELPTVAQQLSGPLGLPAAEILSKLQHPSSTEYVQLATGVSVANDQKIEALSVYDNGIYDKASYAMAYPNGEATANVVGFTNVNPTTGVIAGPGGRRGGVQQAADRHHRQRGVREGPQRRADPGDPGGDAGPGRRLDQADDQLRPPVRRDEGVRERGRQVTGQVVHGRHHPAEDGRHPRHGPVADLGPEHGHPGERHRHAGPGHIHARLDRQGDHRGGRVRARRQDADERLQHPVPDLPGRAVHPGRGVHAQRAVHDRGHHRQLLQRRHVPGGGERPAADPVRLPAELRPRRADRPRPPERDPAACSSRRRSGRPTSATRSPTARASRSTRSRWPASTPRSPTAASGWRRDWSRAPTTRPASTRRPRRRSPPG